MRGWVYKALMIPAPPAAPPLPRGPHTAAPALRPAVPWPVNLARIVLLLESTTWVGIGLAVVASGITTQVLGYLLLGGTVVAVAGLGLWSTATLGGLTKQPREVGLALAFVGLLLGLFLLFRPGQSALLPGLGVVLVVVNGMVVFGLDSTKTQVAFRASAASERWEEATPELPHPMTGAGNQRLRSAAAMESRPPVASPRRHWLAVTRVLLVGQGALWLAFAAWQLVQAISLPTLLPGGGSGCGCADGFGLFVEPGLAMTPAVRILAWILVVAALLTAGGATWAAVALGRPSRAARVITNLLAWAGVAVGLATTTIGMSDSHPSTATAGLALIAVNAVLIWYVIRARRAGGWTSAGTRPNRFTEYPPPPAPPPGYGPPAGYPAAPPAP